MLQSTLQSIPESNLFADILPLLLYAAGVFFMLTVSAYVITIKMTGGMNMKSRIMVLWLLLAAVLLWGCAKQPATIVPTENTQQTEELTVPTEAVTEPKSEISFYEGDLEDAALTSYPLEQLRSCFPYSSSVENNWCGATENLDDYNYMEITDAFPGGVLRAYNYSADEVCYYTVYKVQEGGWFYVFWDTVRAVVPADAELPKMWTSTMLYVPELKDYEDFADLEIGVSTGADVTKIDPAGQFMFALSSRTPSWHLLSDGSVLEIVYTVPEECGCNYTRDKWVVSGITKFTAAEMPCALSKINPADLPA